MDIFSTSREQLENIGDWSSRYNIPDPLLEDTVEVPRRRKVRTDTPAMVAVAVNEPSSDEDEYDDDPDPKWHWIPEGGWKNAPTLFDELGNTYGIKRSGNSRVAWRCNRRAGKGKEGKMKPWCRATVTEQQGSFKMGRTHSCKAILDISLKMEMMAEIKANAKVKISTQIFFLQI